MSDSALNMSAFSVVYPLSKVIVKEGRHYKEKIKAIKHTKFRYGLGRSSIKCKLGVKFRS